MNELHLELAVNKSHLKSDTATYPVSTKLYYSQSHRICPADLLLAMWYQHTWLGFIRSQWVELSQLWSSLMETEIFSVEKKDERDGPIWWLVSCLSAACGRSDTHPDMRPWAVPAAWLQWVIAVHVHVGVACLKKQQQRAELCHHTALDTPYALEQDV